MNERDLLISTLAVDVKPVQVVPVRRLALLWLLLSGCWVVGVTHLYGPLRPGALDQLFTYPHFFIETVGGLIVIVLLGVFGFFSLVPGALSRRPLLLVYAMLLLWLGSYVAGLVNPALEPSMLGKRTHCVFETLLFGLPPLTAAFFMARRCYALDKARTGFLLGLTAGMMPALYMQLACMYDSLHILRFHIVPGLSVGLLGVILAVSVPGLLRLDPAR